MADENAIIDDDQESPAKYLTAIVTQQPANAVGVIGGQVQFTTAFAAVIPAEFTVQWQIKTGGGLPSSADDFSDLVETAGFYENVATLTLTVKAIDNFMASWPTCQFRCKLLFAGSVPTFTAAATLTIPIHTDWFPVTYAVGYAVAPTANCFTGQTRAIVATGLTGPLTYNWTYFDGDAAIQCNGTFLAQPTFLRNFSAAGVFVARWVCTISDGTNTVATDPLIVAVSWADNGASGAVTVSPTYGNLIEFQWTSFVFPPNPLISLVATNLYPLRCAVASGFVIETPPGAVFDPVNMIYFWLFQNAVASNPGSSQMAFYVATLENPAGKFLYLIGLNQYGLTVLFNFE